MECRVLFLLAQSRHEALHIGVSAREIKIVNTVDNGETVNCLTSETLPLQESLAEAERRYVDGTARPLEGLPVIIKEEQPIAGRPATEGSPLFADNIAEETHPLVTRIIEAGGIPFQRSTTPEFCIAAYTRGALWGITRNPWNPLYTPGGSSGGSGAALAAGFAPLATGSDIGGSTRIPSSFNGVVGYKPPYGRNAAMAPYNLDTYCTDGPMARTVADVALLQNVMAGQVASDPVSLPAPAPLEPNADLRGKTVGLAVGIGDYGFEQEVLDAVASTEEWLVAAGATVVRIELPFQHQKIMRTAFSHFGAILIPWIEDEVGLDKLDQLQPYTRQAVDFSREAFNELGVLGDLEGQTEVHRVLAEVFSRVDALVCPVSGVPALLADDYYEDGITIAGVRYASHIEAMPTVIFNQANTHPVLCVPAARSSQNVPIGVQVVGRPFDDAIVFNVGAAIEAGRGLWYTSEADMPDAAALRG